MMRIGYNEWECPVCGRHIVIQIDPYKKIVKREGNTEVAHSAGSGGVTMGEPEIIQNTPEYERWLNEA